jgi:hypothetical protein
MDPIDPFDEADFAVRKVYNENEKLRAELANYVERCVIAESELASLRASLAEKEGKLEALEWAIEDCVAHYPLDIFPDPVRTDFEHLHQRKGASERLHGSWARHLVKVIRENAALRRRATLPEEEG